MKKTDPTKEAKPLFISFEGGEGVGKSTQIRLLSARLKQAGYEVCCVREPGGTAIGEQIRSILLNTANTSMASIAELLLYEAARAQIIEEVIRPALDAGKIVLVDRYTDSTIAYQAYARGLKEELVATANAIGSGGLVPIKTILLENDVDTGLSKATEEGADRLELEGLAFHEQVHQGFARLAEQNPERIARVRCQERKEDTHELVFAAVASLFNERAAAPFNITEKLLRDIKENK